MESPKSKLNLLALVMIEAALLFALGMVGNRLSEKVSFSITTLVALAVVLLVVVGIIIYLRTVNFSLGSFGSSGITEQKTERPRHKISDELFDSRCNLSFALIVPFT